MKLLTNQLAGIPARRDDKQIIWLTRAIAAVPRLTNLPGHRRDDAWPSKSLHGTALPQPPRRFRTRSVWPGANPAGSYSLSNSKMVGC